MKIKIVSQISKTRDSSFRQFHRQIPLVHTVVVCSVFNATLYVCMYLYVRCKCGLSKSGDPTLGAHQCCSYSIYISLIRSLLHRFNSTNFIPLARHPSYIIIVILKLRGFPRSVITFPLWPALPITPSTHGPSDEEFLYANHSSNRKCAKCSFVFSRWRKVLHKTENRKQ